MARAATKGKARRNRAKFYKTLNRDPSRPVVLESRVPHRIDVRESFLIETSPGCAEQYFQAKYDLVEALKKAKRITKFLKKLGPTLATDGAEARHNRKLQGVFNLLNTAEDYATVRLDEIFTLKTASQ
jgi:hypothetical protein